MAREVKLNASAKVAVLGLMISRPSYGYELVDRFERAFSDPVYQWSVSPQAIYNALANLEDNGLIEPIDSQAGELDQSSRRAGRQQKLQRQHYRVTGEGAHAMRAWLAQRMPSSPSREEMVIRLHFGDADDTLLEVLSSHAEACLEELERIAALPTATRLQRLTTEERRLAVQARLSWIKYARAELRRTE